MEPTKKNPAIRGLQSDIMGVSVPASIEGDGCVSCRGPAASFRDELSHREFRISGLCQACQDNVFAGPEEFEEEP